MSWTTPRDLNAKLERLWNRGQLLPAVLEHGNHYPLRLSLKRPNNRELATRFHEVREWIRTLQDGSHNARGFGYRIDWAEINHRELGRNRIPTAAIIPSAEDALRLIGRTRDARELQQLCAETLSQFPCLANWLSRKPLTVLEHRNNWSRILSVLRWFQEHPRPGLYLRQLEIAEVDSKFIENHRGLLLQLLDQILPETTLNLTATGARGFEQRFGLRSKPPLLRFRLLDSSLAIGGFSDLTVPVAELTGVQIPVTRVFVTENEVNGLAFPDVPASLVIFGLGYSVDLLFQIPWLKTVQLCYWGDLDTHGFAMLNRLRTVFPDARSLLMDSETLLSHKQLWVTEHKPHRGVLTHLTASEQTLYGDLANDRLGTRVRLEQERVSYTCLRTALARLS